MAKDSKRKRVGFRLEDPCTDYIDPQGTDFLDQGIVEDRNLISSYHPRDPTAFIKTSLEKVKV